MSSDYKRPDWDEYFMGVLEAVSARATCDRGRSASILVINNRILTTGYVGAPKGLPHCDEVGHLYKKSFDLQGNPKTNCIRTSHAEENAIVQAALHGTPTKGATLYTRFEPCFVCAKMIINAGIVRVVCQRRYHDAALTRQWFKQAGVELVVLNPDEEQDYANKSWEGDQKPTV
jgi:dCMP deaminase